VPRAAREERHERGAPLGAAQGRLQEDRRHDDRGMARNRGRRWQGDRGRVQEVTISQGPIEMVIPEASGIPSSQGPIEMVIPEASGIPSSQGPAEMFIPEASGIPSSQGPAEMVIPEASGFPS